MGSLLSLFRSKRDTKALLEKIQNEIESIEDFKDSASKKEKNCICLLLLAFVLFYFISVVIFYLFYLEPISLRTVNEIVISCLPFIIFPVICFCITRCLQYYYGWIADNKEDRLKELRKQKKKILEKVKETENFKDAKDILEKYDPKALFESVSLRTMNACSTPVLNLSPQRSAPNDFQLRYRGNNTPMRQLPALMPSPSTSMQSSGFRPNMMSGPQIRGQQMRGPVMTPQRMVVMPPPVSTIKPVLPQNRSIVEKVVDYMVNDGPNNRYALICIHCYSHNGMALKEEFEFIAYFCCYCKRFNPSRKAKPMAPRLQPLDQSKRNSLAPLIDEPESDTDSERGRITTENSTQIQEITINTDNEKQKDVPNERDDQNKENERNDENSLKSEITEEEITQTSKVEENSLLTDTSEQTVDENNDKTCDPNESDIPFIDDSTL